MKAKIERKLFNMNINSENKSLSLLKYICYYYYFYKLMNKSK